MGRVGNSGEHNKKKKVSHELHEFSLIQFEIRGK